MTRSECGIPKMTEYTHCGDGFSSGKTFISLEGRLLETHSCLHISCTDVRARRGTEPQRGTESRERAQEWMIGGKSQRERERERAWLRERERERYSDY